jgi:hypothetical protein
VLGVVFATEVLAENVLPDAKVMPGTVRRAVEDAEGVAAGPDDGAPTMTGATPAAGREVVAGEVANVSDGETVCVVEGIAPLLRRERTDWSLTTARPVGVCWKYAGPFVVWMLTYPGDAAGAAVACPGLAVFTAVAGEVIEGATACGLAAAVVGVAGLANVRDGE